MFPSPMFPFGSDSFGTNFPKISNAKKFQRLHTALEKLRIGVWVQHSNMVNLSEGWYRFFDILYGDIVLLEDYLEFIDDPEDRKRVWKFRDFFHQKPAGTLWENTFSLAGKKVRSRTFITEYGTLFSVDILE